MRPTGAAEDTEGDGEIVAARESGEELGVDERYLGCNGGSVRSAAPDLSKGYRVDEEECSEEEDSDDDEDAMEDIDDEDGEDASGGAEAAEDDTSGVSFAGGPLTGP